MKVLIQHFPILMFFLLSGWTALDQTGKAFWCMIKKSRIQTCGGKKKAQQVRILFTCKKSTEHRPYCHNLDVL